MDRSPCYECNLYVANKFRKFQDGPYKEAFCLECNPENHYFVQNPHEQKRCKFSDVVCFNVKYGSSNCLSSNTNILSYDIQGNLIKRKYLYY